MDRRNARYNVWNAALAAISYNLINPYVGIFAVRLGADNLQLGYLSSWPQVVSVAAVLLLASAVGQSRHEQWLIAAIQLVGRTAALGAAAVPFFPISWRVWALIAFWVLAVFPYSAGNTTQQSFLADLFPPMERGKAFASRNAWNTGAAMVTVLVSGWLLDHFFPYPQGYQIVFFLSFLAGLVEILLFLRMRRPARRDDDLAEPDRVRQQPVSQGGWRRYAAVFRHRPFLAFVCCSIPFHFTWQMAWPVFTRFQVTDLGMDNTWLSLVTVANSIVAVIAYPIMARQAERVGNLRMLAKSAMNLATAPVLTALVPSAAWLVLVNLYTGIGVAGVNLFVLNCLLDVSPSEGRPVYLAVHAALVSVSASVAPMVGAYLMTAYPSRIALDISTVFRAVAAMGFYLLLHQQRQAKRKVQPVA